MSLHGRAPVVIAALCGLLTACNTSRNGGLLFVLSGAPRPAHDLVAGPVAEACQAPSALGRGSVTWVRLPAAPAGARGLEFARTETTRAQFRACVDAGCCAPPRCDWRPGVAREEHPVVCVTWRQAEAFCAWAGGRLPSADEWEFAARGGGEGARYPWGEAPPSCERANLLEGDAGCGQADTAPACARPRGNSGPGLCDLAGNAWEWIADGQGPARGLRGASFADPVTGAVGAEARAARPLDAWLANVGFRCARDEVAGQ